MARKTNKSAAAQARAAKKAEALRLATAMEDNANSFLYVTSIGFVVTVLYAIATFSPVV